MGKRKRRADKNKASSSHSDIIPHLPHAPQVDLQSKQVSFDEVENHTPPAVLMDAPGISLKRSPGRESPVHQNHGSSHRILLRHSRHPFGRHYSRRSSSNYSDASPSNWKGSSVYDAKIPYKQEIKDFPAFPYRGSRVFQKTERIRSSSLGENSISGDGRKMECRICQKRLRKNTSVVAVLVCGHVYHVECLEQNTNHENSQDPLCPLCVSQASYVV